MVLSTTCGVTLSKNRLVKNDDAHAVSHPHNLMTKVSTCAYDRVEPGQGSTGNTILENVNRVYKKVPGTVRARVSSVGQPRNFHG